MAKEIRINNFLFGKMTEFALEKQNIIEWQLPSIVDINS